MRRVCHPRGVRRPPVAPTSAQYSEPRTWACPVQPRAVESNTLVARECCLCSQRALGRAALAAAKHGAAAEHFELALSRNPLHADTWFSLGFCHLKTRKMAAAAAAFTRAVQLDSSNGEAWNNLGVLHLRGGRPAAAFTALGVALKHKQANWQVRLL